MSVGVLPTLLTHLPPSRFVLGTCVSSDGAAGIILTSPLSAEQDRAISPCIIVTVSDVDLRNSLSDHIIVLFCRRQREPSRHRIVFVRVSRFLPPQAFRNPKGQSVSPDELYDNTFLAKVSCCFPACPIPLFCSLKASMWPVLCTVE